MKKSVGRPEKIEKKLFENLCAIMATREEISNVFGCTDDTVNNFCKRNYTDEDGKPMTFMKVYDRFAAKGKVSLRRRQFDMSEKNVAMAIWLGKQWLGQREPEPKSDKEVLDKLDELLEKQAKGE